MPNFAEGDTVQVTAGVFEGFQGAFVGAIKGKIAVSRSKSMSTVAALQ